MNAFPMKIRPSKIKKSLKVASYRVSKICLNSPLMQASRQGGLDRHYQDHLGGLDKAYKRLVKKTFKGLLEAF